MKIVKYFGKRLIFKLKTENLIWKSFTRTLKLFQKIKKKMSAENSITTFGNWKTAKENLFLK